jgi:hypothetical protein
MNETPDVNAFTKEHGPSAARAKLDRIMSGDTPRLHPLDLAHFFSLKIKAREMVLAPIIPEKGLVMCYGFRGTGKTHIAIGIAYAVATGGKFLK